MGPKTNCLSRTPVRVNGIQNTPKRRSLMARLSKNMFVTDRIRRLAPNVIMTKALPMMANRNMTVYGTISLTICSVLISTGMLSLENISDSLIAFSSLSISAEPLIIPIFMVTLELIYINLYITCIEAIRYMFVLY